MLVFGANCQGWGLDWIWSNHSHGMCSPCKLLPAGVARAAVSCSVLPNSCVEMCWSVCCKSCYTGCDLSELGVACGEWNCSWMNVNERISHCLLDTKEL